jgi:HEAT repeat protein
MRISHVFLTAFLSMGTPAALVAASFSAVAAVAPGELDRARALVDEAKPHVEQAMNPDNDTGTRKRGRKAAYSLLKEARKLFDDYLDAHADEAEAFDAEYCAISSNLFWIKKFATLNEFRGDDDRIVELPPAKAPETGSGAKASGIGGTSGAGDPDPPADDPRPGTDDPPSADDAGPGAPPRDPAELRAEEARSVFAALQEEESRRPGDVAHLHALYEKFLFEYDDPSLRVYHQAALRLGALTDRMRIVLKEQSGVDPDEFDADDSAEVSRVVKRLTDMLLRGEAAERQRASELLGKLAIGSAGYPLATVLFDDDAIVAKNAADGLVAIGGKRVATNLTKLYRDAATERQQGALDVLTRICRSGGVDARSVSFAVGRFVLSNDEAVSSIALEGLAGLGPAGVPGLLEALSTRATEKRVLVIRALGETGHVPATPRIAMYLLPGSTERAEIQREAATAAIQNFGLAAVPYLIPLLKDQKRKAGIRDTLTLLTGQHFSAARPGDWQQWWKRFGSKQLEEK